MPTDTTALRVGADGETVDTPSEPTNEVVVAKVPGDDASKFVTITLSNPLNEKDRVYLGLPADASTEVGQKVRVNKNGAKTIINAGYATIDPEDTNKVRSVLRGEDGEDEPTAEPAAEAPADPASNPPQARSTPGATSDPVVPQASAPQSSGGNKGK